MFRGVVTDTLMVLLGLGPPAAPLIQQRHPAGSRGLAATGWLHGIPGLPLPRPLPVLTLWTVWYSPRLAWAYAR